MSSHVSTLALHQYRYDELDDTARAEVDAHLSGCDRCRGRLQVQLAQREAFVLQPLPAAIAASQVELAAPTLWVRLRSLLPIGALVAALVVAGLVPLILPSGVGPGHVESPETTRIKGPHSALEIWIDGDQGPRELRKGDVLRTGDRVQLVFDPLGAPYAILAGRDGTGAIEVWKTIDTRDRPQGLRQAPFGLTLDDTPGDQEFILIPAQARLDERRITRIIEGDGSLSNGPDWVSVIVPKE